MNEPDISTTGGSPVLVVGGTGLVGKPIVRELIRRGQRVRVASRHATPEAFQNRPDGSSIADLSPSISEIECIATDARDESALKAALRDCQAVVISVSDLLDPYLDRDVTECIVNLAPQMGVKRVALISGASVAEERRYFPLIDAKFQAEELLKSSGIPSVILRLTWPMESLVRFVRGNRATLLGKQPAVLHPIAGADVGRMVATALALNGTSPQTFTLHGPEAHTMRSWLEAYCTAAAPQAKVSHAPLWIASALATLSANRQMKAAVALMRYFDGQPEYGDPTEANRLLGAPRIGLDAWIRERVLQAGDPAIRRAA